MPGLPSTPLAWSLTLAGLACMLLSLWLQLPMWLVVFGTRSVAPGGGEYMVALFLGLPALLLAFVLLGTAVAKAAWRSMLSCAAFAASLLPLAGWMVLLFRDLTR